MKLILLEDDPLILMCTEDALVRAGFQVFPAMNGDESSALLSDAPDCLAMMIALSGGFQSKTDNTEATGSAAGASRLPSR